MRHEINNAGGPPATILIVDDMTENLMILGNILQDAGYTVKAATSGALALRFASKAPYPGLILLDIMMPEMDGYAVLRALRDNASLRDIPVIFLTALSDPDEIVKGLQAGAADYIAKPIQPEVVLARVANQLEAKLARDLLKTENVYLSHQRELILDTANEGILGLDANGVINFINPAATTLLGYAPGELSGRPIMELWVTEFSTAPIDGHPLQAARAIGVSIRNREMQFRHRNGQPLTLELSCAPIHEAGQLTGAVVTLQDRSERKRYLAELERKSNYDDLTGLPNRNLLNDRLAQAIERTGPDELVAVLSVNLDRFNSINDSLGREAGNAVLLEVAQRLAKFVPSRATLARLDADEFVVAANISDADAAARLAQPLLHALAQPFTQGAHDFFLTASIGIAVFPKDGEGSDNLLRNAAAAMVKAKSGGGNRFAFYTAAMNAHSLERLELENGLRRALDRDELMVFYQPQLSLRTGEIIGAEALVRWQHPEKGLLMPGMFIPLAEESGLIMPLGEWVLRTACAQNKSWQESGLPPITVAVNMSARQFAAQDVVKMAAEILKATGLSSNYLELELTESMVMADADAFIKATEELKGLAITLSIDDFGTGFSSLNYLKRFAIDRLKIDQSFVHDVTHDANSASIALAIISLAHNLKLSVIAEGVETEAQLNFLRRRDCDEMQGYFFSKPVPAAEFEKMLCEQRKLTFLSGAELPVRTLLLVDDEPSILSALKRLFRREGYAILTAESGKAGLELLACHDVGVVISDARMPEMDGGVFLGKVREMYPQAVRMMLSGYTDLKAVTTAVNRGELFCFLTKPWDDNELLETTRDAFRHFDLRRHANNSGYVADE
jgi:diguanylate cyclase (GGDEF)-like protein/PAS domain S-box-containing protein